MSDTKPEESTRTAFAAAILGAYEVIQKISPRATLRSMLQAGRNKTTISALIFAGITAYGGYKAYDNVDKEPAEYGPAAGFAVFAAVGALGVKRNTRRLLMVNHYLKMEATHGAAATERSMREFAAPSLKRLETLKRD